MVKNLYEYRRRRKPETKPHWRGEILDVANRARLFQNPRRVDAVQSGCRLRRGYPVEWLDKNSENGKCGGLLPLEPDAIISAFVARPLFLSAIQQHFSSRNYKERLWMS